MQKLNINIEKIRQDFPILNQKINGYPLVYFDNAATTQKPKVVIETVNELYTKYNGNIHRGVHFLSQKSTEFYENARKKVAAFINAPSEKNIIFTKGATESINFIAFSLSNFFQANDEIIISEMEHHANIVPWQFLAQTKNIKIKYLPINDNFALEYEKLDNLISDKTKLISIIHVSNTLGTINDIKKIIEKAKTHNIPVLIDAAQSIQHIKIDVQHLGCDFLAFSGHKIYAETGIGVLYISDKWLDKLQPYQFGGDMIEEVDFLKSKYAEPPYKFEAGTQNYVAAASLGAAIDYLNSHNFEKLFEYEQQLHNYALDKIKEIEEITVYAANQPKCSVISFNLKDNHPDDVATLLNNFGIQVRSGKHCTHPLLKKLGLEQGTVRISLSFYNTFEEIDYFNEKIKKVISMLK